MSKIVTLTFNPALDKSTNTPKVLPEAKLRCAQPVYHPGGGGINISRALAHINRDSLAIYAKGGASGIIFEQLLKEEGINQHPIKTLSPIRENFVVVENETNNQFRFTLPGSVLSAKELNNVMDAINDLHGCEYLVASGSLPKNIPMNIFSKVGEIAKKKGFKLIIDSSKEALMSAFEVGVLLAKPNIAELSEFVGRELETEKEQVEAAKELINAGKVQILVISLGPEGALVVSKDKNFKVAAPKVEKRSTVGAGDSMVAGLVAMLSEGKSIEIAAMYGVACGSAATMNEGTQLCKNEDVDRLFEEIQLKHKHLL